MVFGLGLGGWGLHLSFFLWEQSGHAEKAEVWRAQREVAPWPSTWNIEKPRQRVRFPVLEVSLNVAPSWCGCYIWRTLSLTGAGYLNASLHQL